MAQLKLFLKNKTSILHRALTTGIIALSLCLSTAAHAGVIPSIFDRDLLGMDGLSWEKSAYPRTDEMDRRPWHGCVGEGPDKERGKTLMHRASNLACSGHYEEAAEQISQALSCHETDPDWYITKAMLDLKLGRTQSALDALHTANVLAPKGYPLRFRLARTLIDAGDSALAERILSDIKADPQVRVIRRLIDFYLAVSQEKQKKFADARKNFLSAATLFMAEGDSAGAQECLDHANLVGSKLNKTKNELTQSSLTPPDKNCDKLSVLVKSLASQSGCFDNKVIETLTGTTLRASGNEFFEYPYGHHYDGIQLVRITNGGSTGKHLLIRFDNEVCCVQRSVIEAELNECKAVKANQPWREDYGTVNAYDVPSGQLVLSFHKNGFQSLFQLSLYSTNESTFERPDIQKFFKIPEPDGAKVQFDDFKLCQQILDVAKKEQFGEAERLLEGWMRRNKDNPYAFQTLAKVRAMQKRYEAAIIAMDAAIRFAAQDQLQVSNVRTVVFRDKTYGDRLLIERGTYCIEAGRFQDALDDFAKGFPHNAFTGDQYLLLAKAELGLKKREAAKNYFEKAMGAFFDEARIVKRDEVKRILEREKMLN